MTTEPRMVHLTGERMVFSCLTGTRDDSSRNASTQRELHRRTIGALLSRRGRTEWGFLSN
ncbi:hypothetical protein IscW_ISCW002010 [Ixodes scapularis]|uniref:Uncharacterized protein n=1 Tax=Ixodes scapularis TaxID=6945 RepID=B7PCH6_IXOSC|nr:hypothetical protein IscW_ISCW002010 [Ixodes scapularis]|eukprot:XP_002409868.1 hypothetical protein IscW_ISCW002010 [Ixodes scapularis]